MDDPVGVMLAEQVFKAEAAARDQLTGVISARSGLPLALALLTKHLGRPIISPPSA